MLSWSGPRAVAIAAVLLAMDVEWARPDSSPFSPPTPSHVVMKSLNTKLRNGGEMIDSGHRFLRYRVEREQGDWLWIVANCGTRGWVDRRDVVPVETAIGYFADLSAREPSSAQAHRMLGLAYYEAGDFRRAVHEATQAIKLDAHFADAYADRASARVERNDINGALDDAVEAIRLDPTSARSHLVRAWVFGRKKDPRGAFSDLEEAIRLEPGNAWLFVERAQLWRAGGKLDEALEDLTKALALDPDLTYAYLYRAMYSKQKKDFTLAVEDANTAVQIDPNQPNVYVIRAYVQCELKHFNMALEDCEQAARIDPKNVYVQGCRKTVLAVKGERRNALGEWNSHPKILAIVDAGFGEILK